MFDAIHEFMRQGKGMEAIFHIEIIFENFRGVSFFNAGEGRGSFFPKSQKKSISFNFVPFLFFRSFVPSSSFPFHSPFHFVFLILFLYLIFVILV